MGERVEAEKAEEAEEAAAEVQSLFKSVVRQREERVAGGPTPVRCFGFGSVQT